MLTSPQDLNANVAAGFAINNPSVKLSFPTDNSQASALARLNAASDTLQNLNGPGVGCPVVSTTFQAQQAAILAGQDPNSVQAPADVAAPPDGPTAPPPAASSVAPAAPATSPAAAPPPASTAASGALTQAQIAALAPPLGFQAGVNPTGRSNVYPSCAHHLLTFAQQTGTGDCDGAVDGANGQPILVPCSCPPPQDQYIAVRYQAFQYGAHHSDNELVAGIDG